MIGTVALFQRSNRYFINDRDGGKHLVWERIDRPEIRQVLIRREAPLFEKPRQWETDVCWSLLGRQRQRGQPAGVSYICPYNTVVLLLTTWTLLQMGVDLSPRNSVDTAIAIRIDLLLDIAAGHSPEVRSSAPRAPDHAAGTKDQGR